MIGDRRSRASGRSSVVAATRIVTLTGALAERQPAAADDIAHEGLSELACIDAARAGGRDAPLPVWSKR